MIRTFNFVFGLQRSEEKRKVIHSMMEQIDDVEYDLQGWHLHFDQKRKIVTVTSNGTDDYLEYKFIPAEISYKSLQTMMGCNEETDDNDEEELEIKFL